MIGARHRSSASECPVRRLMHTYRPEATLAIASTGISRNPPRHTLPTVLVSTSSSTAPGSGALVAGPRQRRRLGRSGRRRPAPPEPGTTRRAHHSGLPQAIRAPEQSEAPDKLTAVLLKGGSCSEPLVPLLAAFVLSATGPRRSPNSRPYGLPRQDLDV